MTWIGLRGEDERQLVLYKVMGHKDDRFAAVLTIESFCDYAKCLPHIHSGLFFFS